MRYLLLIMILMVQSAFGYFYERKYEGMSELWKEFHQREECLDLIANFLPENPTIFESGAFNGEDSARLSAKWPSGRVISFEPNPNAYNMYLNSTKDCKNTEGHNLAVNTYNGMAEFFLCWGSEGNNPIFEGASSLLKASEDMKINYQGPVIQVPCVILDDWCKKQAIESVDFMWLDLEGFELQLLKSSPEILSTVKVIYTETNLRELRKDMTQFDELDDFLEKNGFHLIAHWYLEGYQGDAIYVRMGE